MKGRRDFIALLGCSVWVGTLAAGGTHALAQTQAEASTGANAAQSPKNGVLVVGDSISAEYGLARGTGWVTLLQKRLNEQDKKVSVHNASISGDTTSGGRARLPALLTQYQPAVVVLELGSNDALRGLSLAATEDNLNAMTTAAQKTGAKVLLVGMQVPPNYGPTYMRDFAAAFAKVAKARSVPTVPFLLAGVADTANPTALFQSDRLHPNEQAQPILLNNVWPYLSPLLPGN